MVGILKTGSRKLFYTDGIGKILELSPVCLLDFYVHESYQRSGYGKELYEYMLRAENTSPSRIAIDRPSQKLIGFMRKHYGLADFVPQNNNYVIYRQYFGGAERNGKRIAEEGKGGDRPVTQKEERDSRSCGRGRGREEAERRGNGEIERSSGEGRGRGTGTGNGSEKINCNVTQRSPGGVASCERAITEPLNGGRNLEAQVCQKEASKVTYTPILPWATTARFALPNTTSSQYGNHACRK